MDPGGNQDGFAIFPVLRMQELISEGFSPAEAQVIVANEQTKQEIGGAIGTLGLAAILFAPDAATFAVTSLMARTSPQVVLGSLEIGLAEATGMTVGVGLTAKTLEQAIDLGRQAGRTGAGAELITASGTRYLAISGEAVKEMNPRLQAFAMSNKDPSGFCYQCAEVHVINAALNAGESLQGATIRVLQMGRTKSAIQHGTAKPPCATCQAIIEFFTDIFGGQKK